MDLEPNDNDTEHTIRKELAHVRLSLIDLAGGADIMDLTRLYMNSKKIDITILMVILFVFAVLKSWIVIIPTVYCILSLSYKKRMYLKNIKQIISKFLPEK